MTNNQESDKVLETLNPSKVWIPIFIGIAAVVFLFYRDPNFHSSDLLKFSDAYIPSIALAIFVIFCRDLGYVYRIRTITEEKLGWMRSIYVIILWEFSSAVTPSVVGGTAVAIFILTKEGIPFGKALAYVLLTAIMDNLFLVITAPIIMFFVGDQILPVLSSEDVGYIYFFWFSYTLITTYTLVMAYALFVKPQSVKWLLIKITKIRWFRRWQQAAVVQGDELILASKEIRVGYVPYWFKIIFATIFVWSARYLMANTLITAYVDDLQFMDHLVIFARQIIMWIIMLISPTPGSSGTAEFFFNQFFSEYLGKYTNITVIIWRMFSYYPYLLLGAIFLPRWIKQVFFKKA